MIIMLDYFNRLKEHHKIIFALIIGFSVILFWRGIWGLADMLTTPMYGGEHYQIYFTSFLGSAIIGLLILIASGFVIKELV